MTNFVEISSLETNTHAQYSRPKLTFLPIGGFPNEIKTKKRYPSNFCYHNFIV